MNTPTPTPSTTAAFRAQAAVAFGTALAGACLGIAYLPVDRWQRAFLATVVLFLVSSSFTLAKVVRDTQESGLVMNRVDQARLEKLLAEHDPYKVPTS